ncbi:MAG: tryptophan-rich sensory protein [Clostridia bacterium]|nr:tryptophan-rich sensory protein [Clostridia bacterium]
MNKKINYKTLAICILIPLAVGGLSALLTMGSMEDFASLEQPPLSPPGWLFPVVWTILYTLMGIASYIALETPSSQDATKKAFKAYFLQLGFNFFWSIIFFSLGAFEIAFAWLCVLLALIVITTVRFWRINKWAGILMLPYIAWVTFAGYLNLAIAYLN